MATTTGKQSPWAVLALICAGVVMTMTTWFSAAAAGPELVRAWQLDGGTAARLTNGVQIGFVTGALLASGINLPDIVRLNRLMAIGAIIAAVSNAALLLEPAPAIAITCRIVTGAALACVYPPAMKLVSTWFIKNRGVALGAVIASLTFGSSLPHLFRAVSTIPDWRLVITVSTVTAIAGAAILARFASEGPHPFGKAVFRPSQTWRILKDRNLALANAGYFGHMWELYAMWAWLLAFMQAALQNQKSVDITLASALTFAAVASGIIGCFLGGILSDRFGRAVTTAGMMLVSGSCAVLIGFAYDGPLWLLMVVVIIWGIAIIGDSAQFSAIITELCPRELVGTALSLQMAIGFALTIFTIWIMPHIASLMGGWQWAFILLAPGPFVGAFAMLQLRSKTLKA